VTDLTPMPALGPDAMPTLRAGALTLAVNEEVALAALALGRGAPQPVPMGLALPGPGARSAGNGLEALWTGPGQWLLAAEGRAAEDVVRVLKPRLPGCAVTEQTDAWMLFEITSTAGAAPIARLLEKLVNLPPETLAPGGTTRTVIEHMPAILVRRSETALAILAMRSMAKSMHHALATAAHRLEGAAT